MLYIPSLFDLEEELCDGIWSREQLEQMNDVFTRAVSRAFSSGHESPAAAAATVRIGPLRNGKGAVIEAAIDAAWILALGERRRSGLLGNRGVRKRSVPRYCSRACPRWLREAI